MLLIYKKLMVLIYMVFLSIFLQENNWAIDYEKLLIKIPKI